MRNTKPKGSKQRRRTSHRLVPTSRLRAAIKGAVITRCSVRRTWKGLASLSEAGFEALPSAFSPAGSFVLLHEVIPNRELMATTAGADCAPRVLS
jgi:hypothetical protein